MNNSSRTKNVMRNVAANVLVHFITVAVTFVSRRIFIDSLGVEYLGLNGLFSNVLSVLALTELGVGSAITYNLYKPIVEDDKVQIAKLINYYKKLYHLIGCIILVVGVALIPFLKYIVNFDDVKFENRELYLYYFLTLINTVITYFFSYRTIIVSTDQKGYKLQAFNISFMLIQLVLQAVELLTVGSYVLYILIQIFCSLLKNIIVSYYSTKKYPFIVDKYYLEKPEKKKIFAQVKYMFSYQIGNVVLNNTDNILISVIVNTTTVGLYSNYLSVIGVINTMASMPFTSMQSSIGNFLVKADKKQKYSMFKMITLMAFIIYTVGCVGIYEFTTDVIYIWLKRESLIMSNELLIVCIFNFYLAGLLYPIWCYRNTIGLFRQTKSVMLFTSVINLGLSIVLGKLWGLIGILLATGISRIMTTLWYEPYVLFKNYFDKGKKELFAYYGKQILCILEATGIIFVVDKLTGFLSVDSFVLNLIVRLVISLIVPAVVILCIHGSSNEFKDLIKYAKSYLIKLKRRVS